MGYLILALFTSILLLASGSLQRDNTSSAETYTQGTVNQQATDTMRYPDCKSGRRCLWLLENEFIKLRLIR